MQFRKVVAMLVAVVFFVTGCASDQGPGTLIKSGTASSPEPVAQVPLLPGGAGGVASRSTPGWVSPGELVILGGAPLGASTQVVAPAPVAAQARAPAPAPQPIASGDQLKNAGLSYTNNALVYQGQGGEKKVLQMGMQTSPFEYECAGLIPGMQHPLTVQVQVAFNPSKLWEVEYSRLFAIYQGFGTGAKKGEVTKGDLYAGMRVYLGQYQEKMCTMAGTKSIKDLASNPTLGFTAELGKFISEDKMSPFEVKVQTVRVVLPEKLLRALVRDAK